MISYYECPCEARYSGKADVFGQRVTWEFDVDVPDHCIRCGKPQSEFRLMRGPCAMESRGDWPYAKWERARFQAWRKGEPMPDTWEEQYQ